MSENNTTSEYMSRLERWLSYTSANGDSETAAALSVMAQDSAAAAERFSSYMTFGTAGLRGVMEPGTARMNIYTVRHATQGFADFIHQQEAATGEDYAGRGVIIGYDSRMHSDEFARECACVMAANGIRAYLFTSMRPTPELSFAVRHLHCIAGINITASHNPKEYNGYKAYWEDGAQLSLEQADEVSACIGAVDIFDDIRTGDYDVLCREGRITAVGEDFDDIYMDAVMAQRIDPAIIRNSDIRVVYTPLHGAGYRVVPELLRRCGLKNLIPVPEQMIPDGTFPTAPSPNPEYPVVFELGRRLARDNNADLIIANDPDADRTGLMIRRNGEYMTLTGNQIGMLLLDYILDALTERGTLPADAYAIKSIVTTPVIDRICEDRGIRLYTVLTGFKFIGEVIKNCEQSGVGSFVFGFEESYGFLRGTYARDKDAAVATMLITEMAAYYRQKGMTLADVMDDIYARYGYHMEETISIAMRGLDGMKHMKEVMHGLRSDPPADFAGERIVRTSDYLTQTVTVFPSGETSSTGLPESDVLSWTTEQGDVVVVRPSGTEPKLKVYYMVHGKDNGEAAARLEAFKNSFRPE